MKDELDTIDDAPFLFSCGALSDIYEIIGKTSNAVQKLGMISWEVSNTIETYSSTLEKIAENLKNVDYISLKDFKEQDFNYNRKSFRCKQSSLLQNF